jgi:flagellar motor switch protein FliM
VAEDNDNPQNGAGGDMDDWDAALAAEQAEKAGKTAQEGTAGGDMADDWAAALEAEQAEKAGSEGGDDGWGEALAEAAPAPDKSHDDLMKRAAALDSKGGPLSQDDIDSLMGDFGNAVQTKKFRSVVDEIIHKAMQHYDRLPMLDIVFERFVVMLTNALKQLTSSNLDISIKSIKSMRFQEAIGSVPIPGMIGVIDANPWNGQLVLAFDAPFLYSSLEILLGGRKSKPGRADGRAFTSIERRLANKLMNVMLGELTKAFSPLTDVTFSVDRIEANPQFAAVAQNNSPVVHAMLDVTMDERKGQAEFIIPYGTIDPIRKLLSKVFLGEKLGGDNTWEAHMKEEVGEAKVAMRAILTELQVPLETVIGWRKGEVISLDVDADHAATLVCGKIPMFVGKMGQKSNRVAVKIETDLDRKKEVVDDILSR